MVEPTISDFISKPNEGIPFQERARKFEEEIKPITEKWGVMPWAGLQTSPEAIIAIPLIKDLWQKA